MGVRQSRVCGRRAETGQRIRAIYDTNVNFDPPFSFTRRIPRYSRTYGRPLHPVHGVESAILQQTLTKCRSALLERVQSHRGGSSSIVPHPTCRLISSFLVMYQCASWDGHTRCRSGVCRSSTVWQAAVGEGKAARGTKVNSLKLT